MAIKALIPAGQDDITVSGLYQWDYGQVLEIESIDIGSEVVEVHFACIDMTEAIVRPCTFTAGVGTVAIPDDCLEQSSPITAWVYEIEGTQGRTRKVITLPIIARTRPSVGRDIPQEISNRYTELITEVNEAVDALESGKVIVKKAENASVADRATSAGNASSANYAVSAGSADTATRSNALVKTLVSEKSNGVGSVIIHFAGIYAIEYAKTDGTGRVSTLFYIPTLDRDAYGEYVNDTERLYYNAEHKVLGLGASNTASSGTHRMFHVSGVQLASQSS